MYMVIKTLYGRCSLRKLDEESESVRESVDITTGAGHRWRIKVNRLLNIKSYGRIYILGCSTASNLKN